MFCMPIIDRYIRRFMRPSMITGYSVFFAAVFAYFYFPVTNSWNVKAIPNLVFFFHSVLLIAAGGYNAFTALSDEYRYGSYYFLEVLPAQNSEKILSLVFGKNIGIIFFSEILFFAFLLSPVGYFWIAPYFVPLYCMLVAAALCFWVALFLCSVIVQRTGEKLLGYTVWILGTIYFYSRCAVLFERYFNASDYREQFISCRIVFTRYFVLSDVTVFTAVCLYCAVLCYCILLRIFHDSGKSLLSFSQNRVFAGIAYLSLYTVLYYRLFLESWSDYMTAVLLGFGVLGGNLLLSWQKHIEENVRRFAYKCAVYGLMYAGFVLLCMYTGGFYSLSAVIAAVMFLLLFCIGAILFVLYSAVKKNQYTEWQFFGGVAVFVAIPYTAAKNYHYFIMENISILHGVESLYITRCPVIVVSCLSIIFLLLLFCCLEVLKKSSDGTPKRGGA